MSSKVKGRNNGCLRSDQKRAICRFKMKHPDESQAYIAEYFSKKWKVSVSKSTVGYILRAKGRWLNADTAVNYIRLRKDEYHRMDIQLYRWYRNKTKEGVAVTNAMLQRETKILGRKLISSYCPCSSKWLKGFKERHDLMEVADDAKLNEADTPVKQSGELNEMLIGYPSCDIYVLVNVKCAVNAASSKGPFLRIFLCSNVTATDKRKPAMLGPNVNSSEDSEVDGSTAEHASSASALQWFRDLNVQMKAEDRRILLLFDDPKCYSCDTQSLANVKTMFVQDQKRSRIHRGIAKEFKRNYDRFLSGHHRVSQNGDKVPFRYVLKRVKMSWDAVSEGFIKELWTTQPALSLTAKRTAKLEEDTSDPMSNIEDVDEPSDDSAATEPSDDSAATEPSDDSAATEPADDSAATEPSDDSAATEPYTSRQVSASEAKDALVQAIQFFEKTGTSSLTKHVTSLSKAWEAITYRTANHPL